MNKLSDTKVEYEHIEVSNLYGLFLKCLMFFKRNKFKPSYDKNNITPQEHLLGQKIISIINYHHDQDTNIQMDSFNCLQAYNYNNLTFDKQQTKLQFINKGFKRVNVSKYVSNKNPNEFFQYLVQKDEFISFINRKWDYIGVSISKLEDNITIYSIILSK